MCNEANFGEHANRTTVCQIGDLPPGILYRVPDGRTMMILAMPDGPEIGAVLDGYTAVADSRGQVSAVPNTVKLGYDRQGRLYASRYLNPEPTTPRADGHRAGPECDDLLDLDQSF